MGMGYPETERDGAVTIYVGPAQDTYAGTRQ
jgi:hypothetical protein